MATLTEVIAEVQADLAGLADPLYVPETPPDNLTEHQLPAMVVYVGTGAWKLGTASDGNGDRTRWGVHTIMIDFHLAYDDTAVNIAEAMQFSDTIPNRLFAGFAADRFGGTVQNLGDPTQRGQSPIRYALTAMKWGGRDTIGWRYQMDVAVESSITAA